MELKAGGIIMRTDIHGVPIIDSRGTLSLYVAEQDHRGKWYAVSTILYDDAGMPETNPHTYMPMRFYNPLGPSGMHYKPIGATIYEHKQIKNLK